MDWSFEEVELTVNDYFDMLQKELSGISYNKSEHRRKLLKLLSNRTDGAVERKRENISAILIEFGLPYINGYKPLDRYQTLLKESVTDYLDNHPLFREVVEQFYTKEIILPDLTNLSNRKVDIPKFTAKVNEPSAISYYPKNINYYKREILNKKLGLLGEEFVISYEKQKLIALGKQSYANKIEHISKTKGDGAGFDILSFDENGDEKFIEVKTTRMGKESPFYFTRNELLRSKESFDRYNLYRVFNFSKKPFFYELKGALDETCESISTEFMGWPK